MALASRVETVDPPARRGCVVWACGWWICCQCRCMCGGVACVCMGGDRSACARRRRRAARLKPAWWCVFASDTPIFGALIMLFLRLVLVLGHDADVVIPDLVAQHLSGAVGDLLVRVGCHRLCHDIDQRRESPDCLDIRMRGQVSGQATQHAITRQRHPRPRTGPVVPAVSPHKAFIFNNNKDEVARLTVGRIEDDRVRLHARGELSKPKRADPRQVRPRGLDVPVVAKVLAGRRSRSDSNSEGCWEAGGGLVAGGCSLHSSSTTTQPPVMPERRAGCRAACGPHFRKPMAHPSLRSLGQYVNGGRGKGAHLFQPEVPAVRLHPNRS